MKLITWSKVLFAASAGAAALAAGCSQSSNAAASGGDKLTAEEIAAKSREAYAALSSYSDSGTVASEMAGQKSRLDFKIKLQRPNLYRVDWASEAVPNGVVWSDGSGDYFLTAAAGQEKNAKVQKRQDMKHALAQAAGLSWSAAATIPGAFFGQDAGDVFVAPVLADQFPLNQEKNAMVGDVDCYVLSSVMDLSKAPEKRKSGTASTTLWIGRKDFLIRQTRTKYVEKVESSAPASDQAIDDASKKSLELQHKPATPEAIAAMRPQMKAIMKQVQTTLKSGFESGVVLTQTHENIVVNEKLAPSDFAR